jgi:hypothetical protein
MIWKSTIYAFENKIVALWAQMPAENDDDDDDDDGNDPLLLAKFHLYRPMSRCTHPCENSNAAHAAIYTEKLNLSVVSTHRWRKSRLTLRRWKK